MASPKTIPLSSKSDQSTWKVAKSMSSWETESPQALLPEPAPRGLVPSILKAARLLEITASSSEPQSLAQLTRRLDLPKSSVLGICTTLVQAGFLLRQENGRYQLGPRVLELAHSYLANTDFTREFAAAWDTRDVLRGEGVVLAVLDQTDVVYVAYRNGDQPLGVNYRIGMRLPAHCSATGKALLSTLSEAQVRDRYGDTPLSRLTPHSHSSVDSLLTDLEQVRIRGHAIDNEETREGMRCYGAPIFDTSGTRAIAAVAVSTLKLPGVDEKTSQLVAQLKRFADDLSCRLGARTRSG
jgi:DNA-binding IclR family transcriptional regulator